MTKVTTPWGHARVVEEVVLEQTAGDRAFGSLVQLLEDEGGARLVRFAYSTGGTGRRGPVTLRAEDLERLGRLGYHAFLIGERFMAAPEPGLALRSLLDAAVAAPGEGAQGSRETPGDRRP